MCRFCPSLVSHNGRQSFYPLLGEGVDSAPRGVKVELIRRIGEQDESGIAQKLRELRKCFTAAGNNSNWPSLIAVLLPMEKASATLSKVKENCKDDVGVSNALPASVGFGESGMYFGGVENFVGRERPIVIMAKNFAPGSNVNYRSYLAVTRCTCKLIVFERFVEIFAAQLQLSGVTFGSDNQVHVKKWGHTHPHVKTTMLHRQHPDVNGLKYISLDVIVDLVDAQASEKARDCHQPVLQTKTYQSGVVEEV